MRVRNDSPRNAELRREEAAEAEPAPATPEAAEAARERAAAQDTAFEEPSFRRPRRTDSEFQALKGQVRPEVPAVAPQPQAPAAPDQALAAPLTHKEMIDKFWELGRVPTHAFVKMSDAAMADKLSELEAKVAKGGSFELKLTGYTVKASVDAQGKLLKSETKKDGGFFSVLKKVGSIALQVASFIPSPIGVAARIANAAISAYKAIKAKSFLGVIGGLASAVAGGAAAIAGKAVSGVAAGISRVAGSIAKVANGVKAGITAWKTKNPAGLLSAVASVAGGVAGAVGKGAQGVSNAFAKVATWASRGSAGVTAVDKARHGDVLGAVAGGAALASDIAGAGSHLGKELATVGRAANTASAAYVGIKKGDFASVASSVASFAASVTHDEKLKQELTTASRTISQVDATVSALKKKDWMAAISNGASVADSLTHNQDVDDLAKMSRAVTSMRDAVKSGSDSAIALAAKGLFDAAKGTGEGVYERHLKKPLAQAAKDEVATLPTGRQLNDLVASSDAPTAKLKPTGDEKTLDLSPAGGAAADAPATLSLATQSVAAAGSSADAASSEGVVDGFEVPAPDGVDPKDWAKQAKAAAGWAAKAQKLYIDVAGEGAPGRSLNAMYGCLDAINGVKAAFGGDATKAELYLSRAAGGFLKNAVSTMEKKYGDLLTDLEETPVSQKFAEDFLAKFDTMKKVGSLLGAPANAFFFLDSAKKALTGTDLSGKSIYSGVPLLDVVTQLNAVKGAVSLGKFALPELGKALDLMFMGVPAGLKAELTAKLEQALAGKAGDEALAIIQKLSMSRLGPVLDKVLTTGADLSAAVGEWAGPLSVGFDITKLFLETMAPYVNSARAGVEAMITGVTKPKALQQIGQAEQNLGDPDGYSAFCQYFAKGFMSENSTLQREWQKYVSRNASRDLQTVLSRPASLATAGANFLDVETELVRLAKDFVTKANFGIG